MRARTLEVIRIAGLLTLMAAIGVGCASSSWRGAQNKNTVGAYHQFLRDHPNSRHTEEARERLAYLRIRAGATIEAFQQFASLYPESGLLTELRTLAEGLYFERARNVNTADSYREFLKLYRRGEFSARAEGNLYYVEEIRANPTPDSLRLFVAAHPQSDFVAEAEQTIELIEFRRTTSIRKLGVRVDVAPNVVQGSRVRRGFSALVARAYREAGVNVVLIPPGGGPPTDADAWVRVDYHEAPASGTLGGRTLMSHCRVRLYHRDVKKPVWDRRFEAPADHILKGAYGRDKTVFANSKFRFWEHFFVPVSTWAVSRSHLNRLSYHEDVMAIDLRGDMAAVLLERGGVDFMSLATPLEPQLLDRFRRESDLSRWEGVRILNDRLTLIYGPDGAELLRQAPSGVERVARWDAAELGPVKAVEIYDAKTVLLATGKGLYALRLYQKPLVPHRLLDQPVVGVWADHPFVYVIRKNKIEVATAQHLLRHLTGTKVGLGRGFKAHKVRRAGNSLFVFGKDQIAEVSLEDPKRPKVVARLTPDKTGPVADVAADAGHLYLLGTRGLQVSDRHGQWISDSIQVQASERLELKGRFAFLVGGRTLEILDLAPYYTAVAAPAPPEDQ